MRRSRIKFEGMAERKSALKKPLRDPGIDDVVETVRHLSTTELYSNSYLSRSTIAKLRRQDEKATKKPQHLTLAGVLAAAGFEYQIRRKK